MGYNDLSSYGPDSLEIRTPNIDSIGARGIRFTYGYTTASQCVPSRTGIVTGSFAPLIMGQPFTGREWIFTQWYGCRWLRTKRWLIDKQVISARKDLEQILQTMPAPDFKDPELKAQWEKEWLNSRKFVDPYRPPYLNK